MLLYALFQVTYHITAECWPVSKAYGSVLDFFLFFHLFLYIVQINFQIIAYCGLT